MCVCVYKLYAYTARIGHNITILLHKIPHTFQRCSDNNDGDDDDATIVCLVCTDGAGNAY